MSKKKNISVIMAFFFAMGCNNTHPEIQPGIGSPKLPITKTEPTKKDPNLLYEGNYMIDHSVDFYSGEMINLDPTHYHIKIFKNCIAYNHAEFSGSYFKLADFYNIENGKIVYVNNSGGIGDGTYYVDDNYNITKIHSVWTSRYVTPFIKE